MFYMTINGTVMVFRVFPDIVSALIEAKKAHRFDTKRKVQVYRADGVKMADILSTPYVRGIPGFL